MPQHKLKTVSLRLLLAVYRGAGYAIKYGLRTIIWIFRQIALIFRFLWPIVIAIYRLIFLIRNRVAAIIRPMRGTILSLFSHRHIIHFAALFIGLISTISSIGTRVARAEELGTRSVLFSLVSGTSDELIKDEAPAQPNTFPRKYLADTLSVSSDTAIDFDYITEDYVSDVTGGVAIEAPTQKPGETGTGRTSNETYVVREGDTISTIADRFNLSIQTVLWANNLSVRSYIRPGNKLTIPPIDGVLHTVKKGDTIAKIAKTYGSDSKEIFAWNKIGEDQSLKVGETLIVPGGKVAAAAPARVGSASQIFTGAKPADAVVPAGTKMLWPIAARRITQYFTWKHTGVDIAGPIGTPIYAADDGIVELAGWSGGYGNAVIINHGNGLWTRYGHASKLFVKKGDQVKKGQTIMATGSTGRSTGPHLHFEVMSGGVGRGHYRNPFDYIK